MWCKGTGYVEVECRSVLTSDHDLEQWWCSCCCSSCGSWLSLLKYLTPIVEVLSGVS